MADDGSTPASTGKTLQGGLAEYSTGAVDTDGTKQTPTGTNQCQPGGVDVPPPPDDKKQDPPATPTVPPVNLIPEEAQKAPFQLNAQQNDPGPSGTPNGGDPFAGIPGTPQTDQPPAMPPNQPKQGGVNQTGPTGNTPSGGPGPGGNQPQPTPQPAPKPTPKPTPTPTNKIKQRPTKNKGGPKKNKSKTTRSDPVSVVTGEVIVCGTDFALPGTLPLIFERSYSSTFQSQLDPAFHVECLLGPNWCCNWDQWVLEKPGAPTTYLSGDGRVIEFESVSEDWSASPLVKGVEIRTSSYGFEVRVSEGHTLHFSAKAQDGWRLSSLEDRNSNAIQFVRDGRGALTTIEHSGGYRLRVKATPERLLGVALEHAGRLSPLLRLDYDGAGLLVAIGNGVGPSVRCEYDDAGRLTRWVKSAQCWFSYRYDREGRCTETLGPGGVLKYRFDYDETRRLVRVTDSYGAVSSFVHNENMDLVSVVDPMGGLTLNKWDRNGNLGSEMDPAKRRLRYRYDKSSKLVSVLDELGKRTAFEYDREGRPTNITDASGQRWLIRYDDRGNQLEWGRAGVPPQRYEYDARGNLVRMFDPDGHSCSSTYDSRGLPLTFTDWGGHTTNYTWDEFGRLVEEKDPGGSITKFEYDAQGLLTRREGPLGKTEEFQYDAYGKLISRVEARARQISVEYGPLDQVVAITESSGSQLRIQRDLENRVIAVENASGERWTFAYDQNGRTVEEVDFAGQRQRFEYDGSGLCSRRWNGNGDEVVIRHDRAGRITRIAPAGGESSEFEYDSIGRMTSATRGSAKVALEWDADGNLIRERQSNGTVESAFDRRGMRTSRQLSGGAPVKWSYDANGNLTRIGFSDGGSIELSRDALGRESERRTQSGLMLRHEYDALSRETRQWTGPSAEAGRAALAFAERRYRYDPFDNLVEMEERFRGTSRYAYDHGGRLISASRERGESESFSWDVDGNLRAASKGLAARDSRRFGSGGRFESDGMVGYRYDAGGRVVERSQGGRVWRLGWSTEGELETVETPSGEKWTYRYDAFGRRVEKTGPRGSTRYLWDGLVLAQEMDGAGRQEWFFEPDDFRPIAKIDLETGKTLLCVTDQAGTPRELLGLGGNVEWAAQFSAWGLVTDEKATGTKCGLRFQGQWFDEESGLHYNWHRHYDPSTGQYLSPDPIGIQGGPQIYGYVQNPLGWIDPLGLKAKASRSGSRRSAGKSGGKAQSHPGLLYGRSPDFEVTSGGVFIGGSVTVDYYGQRYATASISTGVGISHVYYWLDQPTRPTHRQLFNFLTGAGVTAEAGVFGGGGGKIYSPGAKGTKTATGLGFMTPGGGVGVGGSKGF
jgi:RHS repeat-associated protein